MSQRNLTRVWLKHLRAWRTEAMMTQQELADKARVSNGTIIRIENNHGKANLATVKALATALGITPQQLTFDTPPHADELVSATSETYGK